MSVVCQICTYAMLDLIALAKRICLGWFSQHDHHNARLISHADLSTAHSDHHLVIKYSVQLYRVRFPCTLRIY